jgi:hypothetical protein
VPNGRGSGPSTRPTPVRGDVVTYDDANRGEATHIAFWLGDGRILHPTEREGVDGVVEEPEPAHLRRTDAGSCVSKQLNQRKPN